MRLKGVSSREVTARDDPEQLQMWRGLLMKLSEKKKGWHWKRDHIMMVSLTGKGLSFWKLKRMKTTAQDDPEQVWKDLFEGSVGTDDPCQQCGSWVRVWRPFKVVTVRRRAKELSLNAPLSITHTTLHYLDNDTVDHPQCRSWEVFWIIQITSPKRMAWTIAGHGSLLALSEALHQLPIYR